MPDLVMDPGVVEKEHYDSVANHFDDLSRRFSQPLAEQLVDYGDLTPGAKVLDIGTGIGIVAFEAAHRLKRGGKVLGIDLSPSMLARARSSRPGDLQDLLEFQKMNAEALLLPDQSFDVVLSLFALWHFPNPDLALREMYRVLRPGGRVVLGVGSGPPLLSIDALCHYSKRLIAVWQTSLGKRLTAPGFLDGLVARHIPEATGTHVPSSNKSGQGGTHLQTLLRKVGFTQVGTTWKGYEVFLQTPEEFWELQKTFSSFARRALANAPAKIVDIIQQECMRRGTEILGRGGRLSYHYAALFIWAERPQE